MRLHLLGLPHTLTDVQHSHCAFTQKTRLFAPMLRAQGYPVIHYGNEPQHPGDVEADDHVTILERAEHLSLLGISAYHEQRERFVGDTVTQELVDRFGAVLSAKLEERVEPGDAICITFGHPHDPPTRNLTLVRSKQVTRVETGIGYQDPFTLHRVYESQAWKHWTMGREGRAGSGWESPRREWVIPNYYDPADWPIGHAPERDLVLFFGRITDAKGCAIIPRLAKAFPHFHFVLCGQGDPAPYLGPENVEYMPPVSGRARALLLGLATVTLHPTRFLEPFCGSAVESALCGTPILTSAQGAFTETNIDGVTGHHCATDGDWFRLLEQTMGMDRTAVAASARGRFLMDKVGPRYRRVFEDIQERQS